MSASDPDQALLRISHRASAIARLARGRDATNLLEEIAVIAEDLERDAMALLDRDLKPANEIGDAIARRGR